MERIEIDYLDYVAIRDAYIDVSVNWSKNDLELKKSSITPNGSLFNFYVGQQIEHCIISCQYLC